MKELDSLREALTSCRHSQASTRPPCSWEYALDMGWLRGLFKRISGGRRPPTGPLTTAESVDAEEARLKTLADDSRQSEHDRAKTDSD